MLVRVFGNTSLNPDAVGKLVLTVDMTESDRTNTTKVYDLTGQHELFSATTTVQATAEAYARDPYAMERDNHLHSEIRRSLHDRRDALEWVPIDKATREVAPKE